MSSGRPKAPYLRVSALHNVRVKRNSRRIRFTLTTIPRGTSTTTTKAAAAQPGIGNGSNQRSMPAITPSTMRTRLVARPMTSEFYQSGLVNGLITVHDTHLAIQSETSFRTAGVTVSSNIAYSPSIPVPLICSRVIQTPQFNGCASLLPPARSVRSISVRLSRARTCTSRFPLIANAGQRTFMSIGRGSIERKNWSYRCEELKKGVCQLTRRRAVWRARGGGPG